MNYKFEVSLPNDPAFRCEFAIGGDQTFQQFHDKIVETLKYDPSQMASFYALDKMGSRVKEIALMEMSTDDEDDDTTLVMDVTQINEIVNASCMELDYVFDFLNDRYFRIEYAGAYNAGADDVLPLCLSCVGKTPRQNANAPLDSWRKHKSTADDTSFMEEFSDYDRNDRRKRDDDEDDLVDDPDYEKEDDFSDDEDDGYDERYESIDDYIDKM